MRGISALLFVTLFWLCVSAAPQQAPAPSLPRLIRFSGTILGDDSTPRTGTAGITFSLFPCLPAVGRAGWQLRRV